MIRLHHLAAFIPSLLLLLATPAFAQQRAAQADVEDEEEEEEEAYEDEEEEEEEAEPEPEPKPAPVKKKKQPVVVERVVISEPAFKESARDDWDAFDAYPKRSAFQLRMGGKLSIRSVDEIAFYGGGFNFVLGADTRRGSFGFLFDFDAGNSESGLDYRQFGFGIDMQWVAGPFRFGMRPSLGYFGVDRITSSEPFEAFRIGLGAVAGLDFYRSERWAIGFEFEPRADVIAEADYSCCSDSESLGMFSANFFFTVKYQRPRKVHRHREVGGQPEPAEQAAVAQF